VNVGIFEEYAQALAQSSAGEEVIIVVSNPVELAVHVFSKHIDPSKIIGMGAFLDTIRFRREVAADLGVERQKVRGLVIGQHGPFMVPLWSSVSAFGMDNEKGWAKLSEIRQKNRIAPQEAVALVRELLIAGKVEQAIARVHDMPADLRVFVSPYLTHMTGAKTRVGTAEIVLRLIDTIAMGNQVLTACQTKVCGEFLGVHSVIGVPVLLTNQGIIEIYSMEIWDEEEDAFRLSAEKINELISQY
jgi:malate dehydrogenase